MSDSAALACRSVSVCLGGHTVLDRLDLSVADGEWLAVVGANGAGKSTLLRALAGVDGITVDGDVELRGRAIGELDRRERARLIALVPQRPVIPPGMTIGEYVLLGRTPHLHPLAAEGPRDLDAAHWALAELDLLALVHRTLDEVSGGERQRTFLARALAQESPIVLLDEPTTALDVGHQQEVLELVDRLRATRGLTVVAAMHDLTLAGQYADRLALLDEGRIVTEGAPQAVLTPEHLAAYWGAHVSVVDGPDGPVIIPTRGAGRTVADLEPGIATGVTDIEEVRP